MSNEDATWPGRYLSEDEIVADMLANIKADPEGVKVWRDPRSWSLRLRLINGRPDPDAPAHAGCLAFVGMDVRNYYGLCPHTEFRSDELEIVDGVITDPRHPDNVSGRIIDRVRKALGAEQETVCN